MNLTKAHDEGRVRQKGRWHRW